MQKAKRNVFLCKNLQMEKCLEQVVNELPLHWEELDVLFWLSRGEILFRLATCL